MRYVQYFYKEGFSSNKLYEDKEVDRPRTARNILARKGEHKVMRDNRHRFSNEKYAKQCVERFIGRS